MRTVTTPTLTGDAGISLKPMMPVTFTPAILVTTPYAAGGLAAGAASVAAYEAGRAAGAGK
ncbi:hypothetical protein DNK56_21325 [Streptomyces sp. AC1-42W]|nr:hypothetical protein DNK56_21325 [Streptomyces sp. AC1-42W]PZT80112.1 hypothetical protein DNK55_11360 [Streptomyces sp. AC1-42T]